MRCSPRDRRAAACGGGAGRAEERDRGGRPFAAVAAVAAAPVLCGFPTFAAADTLAFGGGAAYDGVRWNDLHYTRAFKTAARERVAEGPDR